MDGLETTLRYDRYESPYAEQDRGPPLPFISIVVGLFVLGVMTVAPLSGWHYVMKGFGVVLAISYVIRSIRARFLPSPEMILYVAWMTWSLMGLLGGAAIPELFWDRWVTVLQIAVVIIVITGFTDSRRTLSFNLGALILGAGITGAYSYLTGEYQVAETGGEAERVMGLAMNANAFGWIMLLATVAMAYFWMLPWPARWLKYAILALGTTGAGMAAILSGSRKSILGIGAFYILWVFFCYRKELIRRPTLLAAVIFALTLGGVGFVTFSRGTVAATRFEATWEALRGGGEGISTGAERITLYRDVWRVWTQNPVLGVGLDNFQVYSLAQAPAHTEYGEVLCDTGLVGAFIYFSIYVVLWWRCGRIAKYSDDPVAVRTAKLIRAFLVVVMILNFARWNYSDKAAWVMFGSFIGYTNAHWQELKDRAAREGSGEALPVGPGGAEATG